MNKTLKQIFGYDNDWELPPERMGDHIDVRSVQDGIYEIQDGNIILKVLSELGEVATPKEVILTFLSVHPNWRYVGAYETYAEFLLSEPPLEFKGKKMGSGFNYGSTNIILDCPKRLLILAEND